MDKKTQPILSKHMKHDNCNSRKKRNNNNNNNNNTKSIYFYLCMIVRIGHENLTCDFNNQ